MGQFKSVITLLVSVLIFSGVIWGVHTATQSRFFALNMIEVSDNRHDLSIQPPLSGVEIEKLIRSGNKGKTLFQIKLNSIESRLNQFEWIQKVELQKVFPQTLAASIRFRLPIALVRIGGKVQYLDETGTLFGEFKRARGASFPLIEMVERSLSKEECLEIVAFLRDWKESGLSESLALENLEWSQKEGIRAVATYKISQRKQRALIRLGQNFGEVFLPRALKLKRVVDYAIRHAKRVREFFVADSQKIVVKTDLGS